MSSIESIDEILLNHEPALPSSRLSLLEKTATRIILGLGVLLLLGLIFQNDMVWDDGLRPVIWEPVEADAGEEQLSPRNDKLIEFKMSLLITSTNFFEKKLLNFTIEKSTQIHENSRSEVRKRKLSL